MSAMGLVSLNGIRFEAADTWVFHPFTDLLLGRPASRAGVMQISSAFREEVAESSDHQACARIASAWVGGGEKASPVVEADLDGALFGATSFRVGTEFKRVWYLLQNGKLILGSFGCPWDQRGSPEVKQALAEMELLMRTVRYETTV